MNNHPNRKSARVSSSSGSITPPRDHNRDYATLLDAVQASFNHATDGTHPLFETTATGLYDLYLSRLPDDRQTHTCHECRRFIETYGGLVTVTAGGSLRSAMWGPDVPEFYDSAVSALHFAVSNAKIVRPFISSKSHLGVPKTGTWTHLSVKGCPVFHSKLLSPFQRAAEIVENRRNTVTALDEFSPRVLDLGLTVLKLDKLARSEKFLAPMQWLRDLHNRPHGPSGENLLWWAVTRAPDGYCHPRAAVTGSLLEDLKDHRLTFDVIKRRFNEKMHPLKYQRPQAAPAAGNIAAAEKVVEKLGIQRSLERRFARLDECETLWRASTNKGDRTGTGIFAHLKPKGQYSSGGGSLETDQGRITWRKFVETVLPEVNSMEVMVPSHGNFIAILTAAHADAPPILKWGNNCSIYVYSGGSSASRWNLRANAWRQVNAVVPRPNLWGKNPLPELGESVILVLDGAVDSSRGNGNALFPETLKKELSGVRATIEAYSKKAEIGGREDASACGLSVDKHRTICTLRVKAGNVQATYLIDRWD